jgi:hypothetical protein
MKMLLAAVAATLIAAPALAQSAGGVVLTNPEFGDGFDNPGQCQAALSHVRNDQRKDPTMRGDGYQDLSTSGFQAESLRTTRCEMIDGRYQVVFYADGY